jgi:CheY-like chemotaxis protein
MQSTLGWHPKEIRILVVDDEPTARMVVRKLLEKTGYTGTLIGSQSFAFLRYLTHFYERGNTMEAWPRSAYAIILLSVFIFGRGRGGGERTEGDRTDRKHIL